MGFEREAENQILFSKKRIKPQYFPNKLRVEIIFTAVLLLVPNFEKLMLMYDFKVQLPMTINNTKQFCCFCNAADLHFDNVIASLSFDRFLSRHI
jgi:hypothetical protein